MLESSSGKQGSFVWVKFYSEFADKILVFKNNRKKLIEKIIEAHLSVNLNYTFKENDGSILEDICPFTVFGCFNKGTTFENRTKLLGSLGRIFDIKSEIPTIFDGIPVVMNTSSWFFAYKSDRLEDDIPNLWEIFEKAIHYSKETNEQNKGLFSSIYDKVIKQQYIKWKLSMGLYWIRANSFLNLDSVNREFLLKDNSPWFKTLRDNYNFRNPPDSKTYLMLIDECKKSFALSECPYKSFNDLSYHAWIKSKEKPDTEKTIDEQIYKPTTKRYWVCAPGEQSRLWDEFYTQGIIGVGWDDIDDLSKYKSRDEISQKMLKVYGNYNFRNDSLTLWQFSHEIQIGDIVYAKHGRSKIIGRGIINSDYIYDATRNEYKHIRKVIWMHKGEWDTPMMAVKTLTDLTPYVEFRNNLELSISGDDIVTIAPPIPVINKPSYTDDDFLSEVFLDEKKLDTLKKLLKAKKNLILQGAPGVGKTFVAKRLAYVLMGEKDEERIKVVQFHQSYSYEDFVLGFRPNETSFKLTYGPFYDFCKLAEDDLERDYFFIIDEINRGNLGKIFGELLLLIENDKRGEKIQPLYSNELFSVPKNVHIIGMMNTADRSIALIDYALRRRFAFYEILPAFDSDGFEEVTKKADHTCFERLVLCLKELNKEISKDETLGRGFQIGHSYLCADSPVDEAWLASVVNYEILPLISEYWFDDKEKVEFWAEKLMKAINDQD